MGSIQELSSLDGDQIEKKFLDTEEVLLQIAEDCVNHFIASNYAGYLDHHECVGISEEKARKELSRELLKPCATSKSNWSLYIAKRIFLDYLTNFYEKTENIEFLSLKLRFLILWQQVLIDRDGWILEISLNLTEKMEKLLLETKEGGDNEAKILLEMALIHVMYYQYEKAIRFVNKAVELTKLNINLTGLLGKRTRFQHKDIAQLVLVYKNPDEVGDLHEVSNDTPTECSLNDDTLLEQVAVKSTDEHVPVDGKRLTDLQLCCLLWLAKLEKATNCGDSSVHERCMPFLNTVLEARRLWSLQCSALLIRADLEKSQGRRVDRSCSQVEVVCKLMQGIDDEADSAARLARVDLVLCSALEPSWQASVLHTDILRSLGCTAEALLILEKLELWENVIECYKSLGQIEKAEILIRKLLEEKPNDSMLLVYLGDITANTEYYHEAIRVSGDRNARAHKSLGHNLMMQKKYEEAYKHLRKSLELQPIQLGIWFNAGHCAWKLEMFKESAQCYHRCVSFQPDHFEAWNNMSAAYTRNGQKEKAWKLLQEALKFNYHNVHVWENYMLLSVDIGEFSQAIHAYNQLLDLNKRGADDEVLELIGTQLLEREKENNTEEGRKEILRTKQEMIKLLARISANHQTLSPSTLRVHAELKKPIELNADTRTEFEVYIQLLEKSLAMANGKQNWSKDESATVQLLGTAIKLANDRLKLAEFINSPTSLKEASSRVRLSLRGIITRIEKDGNERVGGDNAAKLSVLVDEAKRILEQVSI